MLHEPPHMLKEVVWKIFDLFLLCFHIVMQKVDFEAFWELLIDGVIDEAPIFRSHCLFSSVVRFSQIEAVDRVRVFLEKTREMLSSGNCISVNVLVEHYVWLYSQRIWNL